MTNKIKHIFTDIDNSLLKNEKLSKSNKEALTEIKNKYPTTTLNLLTARSYKECESIKDILFNQLTMFESYQLFCSSGNEKIIINTRTKSEKLDHLPTAELDDNLASFIVDYLNENCKALRIYYRQSNKKSIKIIYDDNYRSSEKDSLIELEKLTKKELVGFSKISTYFNLDDLKIIIKLREKLLNFDLQTLFFQNRNLDDKFPINHHYVEISKITKDVLFQRLEKENIGINKHNSIYIGDDVSDFRLLRYVDNSVFIEDKRIGLTREKAFKNKDITPLNVCQIDDHKHLFRSKVIPIFNNNDQ